MSGVECNFFFFIIDAIIKETKRTSPVIRDHFTRIFIPFCNVDNFEFFKASKML